MRHLSHASFSRPDKPPNLASRHIERSQIILPAGAITKDNNDRDAWMVSYMDIVTLLLTLLVLMLAINKVHTNEIRDQLASTTPPSESTDKQPESKPQTHHLAIEAENVNVTPLSVSRLITRSNSTKLPLPEAALAQTAAVQETRPDEEENDELTQLLADLRESVITDRNVELRVNRHAVNLEIRDNIIFGPASTSLHEEGKLFLNRFADLLATTDYTISIEGHTDNTPIANAAYPSNWELASHRATRAARYLIDQGIAPQRLRTIAYSDTRPIAANDTQSGRAMNRRVSFKIHLNEDSDPT